MYKLPSITDVRKAFYGSSVPLGLMGRGEDGVYWA